MKAVIISDTHGYHNKLIRPAGLPEGDILISCGDITARGTQEEHLAFAKWMSEQPFEYMISTVGNHDGFSAIQPTLAKEIFREYGVELLIDELAIVGGKRIYMSPWSKKYGTWAWMK